MDTLTGNELQAMFEGMDDGLVVTCAENGVILEANRAFCRLLGCAREELIGRHPRSLLYPASQGLYADQVRAVLAGEPGYRVALLNQRKDGSALNLDVRAHDVVFRGRPARMAVVREITDQVQAYELLEQRVAERTRELSTLLEISRAVTSTLELQPLLGRVLDQLQTVVESRRAGIMLVEGDELCVAEYRGEARPELLVGKRLAIELTPIFQAVRRTGGPVIVDDLMGQSALADAYRAGPGILEVDPQPGSQRSVLAVPLKVKDRIIGQVRLDHDRPNFYTQRHADLVLAVASQAAIAIANARLFEEAEGRRRELEALYSAEQQLRGRLEVALEAGQMRTWDWELRTNLVTWSPQLEAIHGLAPGEFVGTFDGFFTDVYPEDLERVKQTIAKSLESGKHHVEYRIIWPDGSIHWLESNGRVVTDAQGQVTGLRGVCQDVTIRKQVEADRNRLLEREKAAWTTAAALEERQRLARELHDSVSQALYGMSLGTQTVLAELAERPDLPAATDAATYVLNLAQAAIAEMRALIFELRPESLQQEGLVAALERHATSAGARHALQVDARFGTEPDLSLEAKEAVYRIAQEALHNVVKHAHAHTVSVRLEEVDRRVVLRIADDGVGFEPTANYPGHFGLTSMRERAAACGAELTITSGPGQGARLTLTL